MSGKNRYPLIALSLLLTLGTACGAGSSVGLRTNTSHGVENARGAVSDAGLKLLFEVRVSPSSKDDHGFLPPGRFIDDAKLAGASILSSSFSGWQSGFDAVLYQKLTANGMLHVYAYEPRTPQPDNAPPPAAFTTVNVIGGMTGHGIEFGVPAGYMKGKGQSSTPSGVTAQLAGLMASLKYRHPDWNWFDVKAALRSTAANYPKGYDPKHYGYGTIDYPAANALVDAQLLPLFPPAAVQLPHTGAVLSFYVNPFQQTRRVADALFKFRSPPSPNRAELSLAQLVSLGGQLLYLGDFTKKGNQANFRIMADEKAWFVWLTRDAAGRFSRIEPYSVLGPVLLKAKQQQLGPRLTPP